MSGAINPNPNPKSRFEATNPAAHVHTADNAVPALDDDTEGLLEDLSGVHEGLDLIRAGARLLMLDRLSLGQTQTVLAALAGSDGADVLGLLAAVVARLTTADSNPALRALDGDEQKNVRRIGEAFTFDIAAYAPRDLVGEACARIDPNAAADAALDATVDEAGRDGGSL